MIGGSIIWLVLVNFTIGAAHDFSKFNEFKIGKEILLENLEKLENL